MSEVMPTFTKFLADDNAWDMFITGPAGSGKTTDLKHQVQYCIDNEIPHLVVAFTHKACEILTEKLPPDASVSTLHSWLKKRPGINQSAVHSKAVDITIQKGRVVIPKVVFIDEYSMVDEGDGASITNEQDPDYSGTPQFKVVWLGDNNQLPPVGGAQYVKPYGEYNVRLTKIYRQEGDSQLKGILANLVSMIEGADPKPLEENKDFVRSCNIVKAYQDNPGCRLLAYTNKRVQELNQYVQGREEPEPGDVLFCPTDREQYVFLGWVASPTAIFTPFNGELILGTKYKTLEHLITAEHCRFARVQTAEGNEAILACVFGHYSYKVKASSLKEVAAESNRIIETKHKGYKAAAWAKNNSKKALARKRSKAWRDFLGFDECVVCLDFNHATTVHKSQGSTYPYVAVDSEDIGQCQDYQLYLKLFYVALSRASKKAFLNT